MRDKEVAGARVLAVAKGQVVDARADEMGLRILGGAAVADAQEAVAVEFGGVLVHDGVLHVVFADANDAACGKLDAIG